MRLRLPRPGARRRPRRSSMIERFLPPRARALLRSPLPWVLLVYLSGIALRVIYTLHIQRPESLILSDMELYVGTARRIAAHDPLGPWDVTHPLGLPGPARVPDLRGRLARARRQRADGHQRPGAARGRPAGRRRVRTSDRPARHGVRQPLLPVHRLRRAVPGRDPLHLVAHARLCRASSPRATFAGGPSPSDWPPRAASRSRSRPR